MGTEVEHTCSRARESARCAVIAASDPYFSEERFVCTKGGMWHWETIFCAFQGCFQARVICNVVLKRLSQPRVLAVVGGFVSSRGGRLYFLLVICNWAYASTRRGGDVGYVDTSLYINGVILEAPTTSIPPMELLNENMCCEAAIMKVQA